MMNNHTSVACPGTKERRALMIAAALIVLGAALLLCVAAATYCKLPSITLVQEPALDVVYINLNYRPDRKEWMESQLGGARGAGLPWRRQAAVDGKGVDLAAQVAAGVLTPQPREVEPPRTSRRAGSRSRGAVGCALSHLEAWDRIKSQRPDRDTRGCIELHNCTRCRRG